MSILNKDIKIQYKSNIIKRLKKVKSSNINKLLKKISETNNLEKRMNIVDDIIIELGKLGYNVTTETEDEIKGLVLIK